MSDIAVIYKSNYGAARSYAIYIAKALDADLYDLRRIREFDFSRYGTIIFGGGIYAGRINGLHFLSSHALELAGKKLAVYTTGIADPAVEENVQRTEKAVKRVLPDELMGSVPVFCFRGALDYSEMSFKHRAEMAALRRFIAFKAVEDLSPDDRMILDTYGKTVSFVDPPAADSLVDYIRET